MTPQLRSEPRDRTAGYPRPTSGHPPKRNLSKCFDCGFWTGATDPPVNCPECNSLLYAEEFGTAYPY